MEDARLLSDQENVAICTARVASIIAIQLQKLEARRESSTGANGGTLQRPKISSSGSLVPTP